MSVTRPTIRFGSGTPGEQGEAPVGGPIVATIDDISNVRMVEWLIASVDDEGTIASYDLAVSGAHNETVTITPIGDAGGNPFEAGSAAILKAIVDAGIDPQTGLPSPYMTTTAKFYVPTGAGYEVLAVDEVLETNGTSGWASLINRLIRGLSTDVGVVPANADSLLKRDGSGGGYLTSLYADGLTISNVGGIATIASDPSFPITINAGSGPLQLEVDSGHILAMPFGGLLWDFGDGESTTYGPITFGADVFQPHITQGQSTSGSGPTMLVQACKGASGSAGAILEVGGGDGGDGSHLAGNTVVKLGATVGGASAHAQFDVAGSSVLDIYQSSANNIALTCVAGDKLTIGGTYVDIVTSNDVNIRTSAGGVLVEATPTIKLLADEQWIFNHAASAEFIHFKYESGAAKIGAFGATPVAKPTGVAVTAAAIHAALVSLGWIAA